MKRVNFIMIFIASLGFDEKFILRSIMSKGLNPSDKIILFLSKPIDDRSLKAFRNIENLVKKAYPLLDIKRYEIEVSDFFNAVSKIYDILRNEIIGGDIIINLSGGQRILILEVLAALKLLSINAKIEIETEDSSYIVEFPLKIFGELKLDRDDVEILSTISDGKTFSQIASEVKLSKTTVWRRLKHLEKEGYIYKENKKYKLTSFGNIFSKIVGK